MAPLNLRRRLRSATGAELIEFALVLPLMIVAFCAIVDFGFLFQRYLVVNNAAREGARLATLPGYGLVDVQNRATAYVREGLGDATATPVVTMSGVVLAGGAGTGRQVVVQSTHNYLILGPVLSLIGGGPFGAVTLTGQSTMRCEIGC